MTLERVVLTRNNFWRIITVGFSGIRTRIVGIEGKTSAGAPYWFYSFTQEIYKCLTTKGLLMTFGYETTMIALRHKLER